MLSISVTDEWRGAHPGALLGLLELSGLANDGTCSALDERKRAIEARLRAGCQGFTRQDFLDMPVMAAYARYYRRFEKTYHVLQQVESIVLKGKSLPDVSPLVDACFAAELETLVLTAGHDAARLQGAISMDVSREGEQMVQMNGAAKTIHAGDMLMRDALGVCCTVIYGQDNRSPISRQSSQALYVAYAPAGVPLESVDEQLTKIEQNIRLFSPLALVEQRRLIAA